MSRATDDAFDLLHALMAEGMADNLKRNLDRAKLPKDDEDYEPLDTKLIQAVRQFLKDNGIDSPAASKRFDGLVGELRDLDLDHPHLN